MSESSNPMDDLFAQIDNISSDIKDREAKQSQKKTNNNNNSNFKNIDSVFLNSVTGNYEFRLLMDSNGEFHEKVKIHSVPGAAGGKKATVVCSGENCELCDKRKQLDELQKGLPAKQKTAWKYNPYTLIKILIKTGEVPAETTGLKSETVYLAFVDEKYWASLVNAIQTNHKYYSEEIKKMMNHSEASSGFLVSANKVKKSMTYNFNFIQQLKIEGFVAKDVFGVDSFKITNQGAFRNNYINPKKLETAVSIMNSAIMANTKTDGVGTQQPPKETTPENKDSNEGKSEEPKPDNAGSIQEIKQEVKQDTPAETPKEEKIEVTPVVQAENGEIVIDPTKIDPATGKPFCFSKFDANSEQCTKKCIDPQRECIMAAYQ
jgi:hypothetical protein